MTDKNPLRSPAVIIGGVIALVAALACAMDDDDDCDSQPAPRQTVFAAGNSGIRLAEPPTSAEPLPASGGFGTHLASCGG